MSIRYGIVGCGNIHKTHADAFKKLQNATLTAFFDELHERAEQAAANYGAKATTAPEAFWDLVDAAIICLPSGMHADWAVEGAKRGKHVLTEKPLDITFQSGLRMVKACEDAGVLLGCISQHRFAADIQRLKKAIDAGELGDLVAGDSYTKWFRSQGYYDSAGWRGTWAMDGGGCLMNQGVHYVDMIQWLMGGVESVQAVTRTASHDIEVEDIANALLTYQNGAIGVLQGSTAYYPGFAERLEVHGTKGSVLVEGDRARIWVTKDPSEFEPFGAGTSLSKPVELPPDPTTTSWGELHRIQIQDFTDAILEKRPPAISGRDALEPLKVVLAVYESAKRNSERVFLAEFAEK